MVAAAKEDDGPACLDRLVITLPEELLLGRKCVVPVAKRRGARRGVPERDRTVKMGGRRGTALDWWKSRGGVRLYVHPVITPRYHWRSDHKNGGSEHLSRLIRKDARGRSTTGLHCRMCRQLYLSGLAQKIQRAHGNTGVSRGLMVAYRRVGIFSFFWEDENPHTSNEPPEDEQWCGKAGGDLCRTNSVDTHACRATHASLENPRAR